MSEPIDHHYVPRFYLSRWAGEDGKICRYSIPFGTEIKTERVSPKGTAFEPHLYNFLEGSPDSSQNLELDLMKQIDNDAAIVLEKLEMGTIPAKTSPLRKSWAKFLIAQLLRSPEDVEQLKYSVEEEWTKAEPAIRQKFRQIRQVVDPIDYVEFMEQKFPNQLNTLTYDIAKNIYVHDGISNLYAQCEWSVIEFSDQAYKLLTSDRPIWSTATMTQDDDFLWLTIGPKKLFILAPNREIIKQLKLRPRNQLAKTINGLVAEHAVKFVFGADDKMRTFVTKYFATKRHSSFLERLAAMRGNKIVSPKSPNYGFSALDTN